MSRALQRLWQWLWRTSFLRRLALSMAVVHIVVLGITLADLGRRGVAAQTALEQQAALQEARQLAAAVRASVLSRDLAGLAEQVDVLREAGNLRYAMVLDVGGRVLAHTAPTFVGQYLADPFSRERLQAAAVQRPFIAQDTDALLDVWSPVRQGDALVGWVRVGHDPQRHTLDPWALLRDGLWYGLATVAAGLLLAVWIAGNLGRDVGRLQTLLRSVREGDLTGRIAVNRQDELGELMDGVNRTLQRLERDEADLRHTGAVLAVERGRMAAVLASMRQGVLALDTHGAVALCNRAFCQLLGLPGEPEEWSGKRLDALLMSSVLPPDVWRDGMEGGSTTLAPSTSRPTGPREHEPRPVRLVDGRLLARDTVPIADEQGHLQGTLWLVRDVTEERVAQERLRWQALHDPLTRLPNRFLLGDRLTRAMARARREQELLAVCMLDLDGFKVVNDSLGHDVGDELLIEVAQRLRDCVRAEDTVARLGGDEFVLLLGGLSTPAEVDRALTRVCEAVARPYESREGPVRVAASIGVTLHPLNESDADILLRHADQAMYQAKQAGGNRYVMFDLEFSQRLQAQQRLRERVRGAIDSNRLVLHYQPRVDMRSGRIVGAEALVRWVQPDGSLWYPDRFLPNIEHDALIESLGDWVLREALRQLQVWQNLGCAVPVSVNIAARHFQRRDFVPRLVAMLREMAGVAPSLLEIELVESAALDNLDQAAATIQALGAIGVTVAIDDFGMGYSSLGYLRRLPVDRVKIDRSFVMDMLTDHDDLEVVQAVIGLAHTFRRQVLAEGVETPVHGAMLLRLGCDEGQGYGIARPMPAGDWPAWHRQWQAPALWREWGNVEWPLEDLLSVVESMRTSETR